METLHKDNYLALTHYEKIILQTLHSESLHTSLLAQVSGIPRTSLSIPLRKLLDRGFIRKYTKGRKVFYKIKESSMPSRDESSKNTVLISTYRGIDMLKKTFMDMADKGKNKRIIGIQPTRSIPHLISKYKMHEDFNFNTKVKENKVIIDCVLEEDFLDTAIAAVRAASPNDHGFKKSLGGRMASTNIIPKKTFSVATDILILDDTVYIYDWEDEITIIIKQRSVAIIITELMSLIKKLTKKIDQNSLLSKM